MCEKNGIVVVKKKFIGEKYRIIVNIICFVKNFTQPHRVLVRDCLCIKPKSVHIKRYYQVQFSKNSFH